MSARGLRIAIVGGGIGGLTLALALRQRGLSAKVYEQASELTEIGAAVALSANATRELRRLGVLDQALAAATEPTELIFRDGRDGRRIAAHPVRQDGRYRERFGAPYLGIHRADLQRILGGALGGEGLHLGHRLSDLVDHGSGVELSFANGRVAQADLAVGADGIRSLVRERFADTMFFDETKRAMISVEQRTDVDSDTYTEAQTRFQDAAFDLLTGLGLGLRYRERVAPDADGEVPFRIDPTIISTDIESVLLDKDRGAQRAFDYFAGRGPLPHRWRSIGDSRSDYKMADFVHGAGYEVAHVDVRPADGLLDRPYEVITIGDAIHDDAGAEFLAHWRRELGLD